jgi:serine protease Do
MKAIFLFLLLASCAKNQIQVDPLIQTSPALEAILQKSIQRVYQIVVAREEEIYVDYDKEIPWDVLPFDMRDSKQVSIGSAFSIEPGKFISCAHVFLLPHLTHVKKFYLKDPDNNVFEIDQVLRYSEHKDFIEFSLKNKKVLPTLPVSQKFNVGEMIFSVGNALGTGISVRNGIISSISVEPEFGEWKNIRFSAAASPGNSGGPLINAKGEIVGLIQAKSENENLNYALPVEQFKTLAMGRGQFKIKQFFSPYGLRDNYVIDVNFKLPQSLAGVSAFLSKALTKNTKINVQKFFAKHDKKLFRADPAINTYLRNQLVAKFWNQLTHSHHWTVFMPSFELFSFPNDEAIALGQINNPDQTSAFSLAFIYQNPKNVKIEDTFNHPQKAMTKAFQTANIISHFGNVELKIKNLKQPEATEFYTDHLGRTFRLDTWRLRIFGTTYLSACTPHPKGIACLLSPGFETQFEGYGGLNLVKHEIDSWIFSPSGRTNQWKEFFKLPNNLLPPIYQNVSIDESNKVLSIKTPKFSSQFQEPKFFNALDISLETGFEDSLPLRLGIKGIGYYDSYGSSAYFYLPQNYPINSDPELEKITWRQTKNKTNDYSGEIFHDKNEQRMILVGHEAQKRLSPMIPQKPQTLHRVFCYADNKAQEKEFKNSCRFFFDKISF